MHRFEGLDWEMVGRYAPRPGQRELLPALSEKAKLALTCRMLFREGWNEHIAGHITVRQADGTILTNPWELAWDEITASDVVTLDAGGKVIDGDWNVTPALGLHIQIHELRPDVNVVVHNHPYWSGLWADMHRVPPVYDQASAYVAGDLPLYDEYAGQFDDADTTMAAARALGNAKWALLANHGSLVVAKDLRQTHLRVSVLEWRSMRAWRIEAAGGGKPMDEAQIAKVGSADDNGFPFLYEAMARRELRRDPGLVD